MKPRNYLLLLLVLGLLIIPVASNGPDYGTTYKSGYTYVSDTVGFDYNQPTIAGSWNNWPSYNWAMAYNSTLKTYPNIFWVYNAELYNTTASGSFAALPPVLETKIRYESGGNHAFTVKYKFYKYQDRPDLSTFEGNLYGNFEYVNYPYLQSLGSDTVFSPTVLYDNISCYNYDPPACQGATLGLLYGGDISFNITKTAGFALQRLGTNEMAYSASRTYFNSYNANWKTLYQVWNDISDFSKFVVVNRTTEYTQTTKVRFYQGLNISWESTYGTTNLSIFLSNSTGRIVVNASGWQEQTIWDDNTSYAPPPPPGPTTWDLNVFTYDGSSGALYNGATVTKTDLTDPAYNGWGISGVDYPGRTDFQAIQGHEYNLSATAVGMSTGYANYTASTSPSIVKLYLYPDLGYSTLEFKVVDTGDRPITGLPVRLSDGRGKLTIAGFTRFNSTSGVSYGWTVGDATTSQYVPQTGNVTATAGRTIIEVVMPLVSEIANLTEPTPSSPHASAQEFMDFIYEMVPGLAMVAVVFLFLAMMGFNPAGMAGKRSGRRK